MRSKDRRSNLDRSSEEIENRPSPTATEASVRPMKNEDLARYYRSLAETTAANVARYATAGCRNRAVDALGRAETQLKLAEYHQAKADNDNRP
jgi:hypothetical protein